MGLEWLIILYQWKPSKIILKDQFLLQVIQTQKKKWNFNSITSILNFNFDLVLFNWSPPNEKCLIIAGFMCPHDSDQVLILLEKGITVECGRRFFQGAAKKGWERMRGYNVRRGLSLSLGFVVSHMSLICAKMGDNRRNQNGRGAGSMRSSRHNFGAMVTPQV